MKLGGNMISAKSFLKYRSKIVKLAVVTLSAGGATTGDTKTDLQNVRQFKEGTFFLRHTGLAGTTKTLVVLIVTKDPSGSSATHYHTLATFSSLTSTSAESNKQVVTANMGAELAITWTKGSADIATTFTVYGVCK